MLKIKKIGVPDEVVSKRIFVAITRATKWVYMSTVKGREMPLVNSIIDNNKRKTLTIRRYEDYNNISNNIVDDDSDDADLMTLF